MNGRLLVAVCGVGDPEFDAKLPACINNINIIRKTAPREYKNKIDFIFFAYDDRLTDQLNGSDCKIVRETGFVGEFIYKHLQQHMVEDYDRIILMLDDIEIQPDFNLNRIMCMQDKFNFDIMSPLLTTNSEINHDHMVTRNNLDKESVIHTDFIEFFMYIMKPDSSSYATWLSCFDQQTKAMWGLDMIMSTVFGLKLGLANSMTIKHMFKGGSKSVGGREEMIRLFKQVSNKYQDTSKSTYMNNLHKQHFNRIARGDPWEVLSILEYDINIYSFGKR